MVTKPWAGVALWDVINAHIFPSDGKCKYNLLGQTYEPDMLNSAPIIKTTGYETFPVVYIYVVRTENSLSFIGLSTVLSELAEVSIISASVVFC